MNSECTDSIWVDSVLALVYVDLFIVHTIQGCYGHDTCIDIDITGTTVFNK